MFHHNTALGRALCLVTSLLLSLAAIIVGLYAFNYDLIRAPFVQMHLSAAVRPLEIVIGIAGVLSLFFTLFGKALGESDCHSKHDDSKKR